MTTAEPAVPPPDAPFLRSAAQIAKSLGLPAPTTEQTRVIEAPLQPGLVVAGAGSGKTETMAARVVYLVANEVVAADQILGLTFTRKAAAELRTRIRERLTRLRVASGPAGAPEEPVTVSTYHSYAAALVAQHGLRIGVEPTSTLLGEAAAWQLAAAVVESSDVGLQSVGTGADHLTGQLISLASGCAEHLVDQRDLDRWCARLRDRLAALPTTASSAVGQPKPLARKLTDELDGAMARLATRTLLATLVGELSARKAARGAVDFGDQVAMAAELAGLPDVGAGERVQYPVVLLDEFQDTSYAQLRMLSGLFGAGHPVTAVGDPHQSIYGWRGASAGNLESFPQLFPHADGTPADVLGLATSWRNDHAILDAANRTAAPLSARSAVPVKPLRASPVAADGCVRIRWHDTADEEISALASALSEQWHRDERAVEAGRRDRVQRPSMAVLCRRRTDFHTIEAALRTRGLPVRVFGLGGLLDRPEVGDIVATLQVLVDPSRGDALIRLMTGPRWRIGAPDIRALQLWARELDRASHDQTGPDHAHPDEAPCDRGSSEHDSSEHVAREHDSSDRALAATTIVEALDALPAAQGDRQGGPALSEAARVRLTQLAGELAMLRSRASRLTLTELVTSVIQTLCLDMELAALPEVAADIARSNLDAFADVAASFGRAADPDHERLPAFLAWLAVAAERERGLSQAPDDVEDNADTIGRDGASRAEIHVLTVHAAKGLEWDIVAVPGLVDGIFPHIKRSGGDARDPGWSTDAGQLPYPLRGDRANLPSWDTTGDTQETVAKCLLRFKLECGNHRLQEERRLAYVAFTRARSQLWLSGSCWRDGKRQRKPSPFLLEILDGHTTISGAADCTDANVSAGAGRGPQRAIRISARSRQLLASGSPTDDNPSLSRVASVPWPQDALSRQRSRVLHAARQVDSARRSARDAWPRTPWSAQVDVLLAERDSRGALQAIDLPMHLSASRAVALARDPQALALYLRRPVPSPPNPQARRGTAFHTWVERRLRAEPLVDLDDLPGATDLNAAADSELDRLRVGFEASEWADRRPIAVEVDVETPVGGTILRGRIDAVFARPDSGVDIVDWKTGHLPSQSDLESAAVQLAVYRVAWSRLHDQPLDKVHAAFCFVASGQTLRPADHLDEDALLRLIESVPMREPLPADPTGRERPNREPSPASAESVRGLVEPPAAEHEEARARRAARAPDRRGKPARSDHAGDTDQLSLFDL